MTEVKKAVCKPRYKKEFSIFEDETLEKLKDFRAARSKWITSCANQTINTDFEDGFYKNEYKGRYAFFRRKWFKTFLRVHYKSVRPLKYYTLKQKLSRTSLIIVRGHRPRGQDRSICKTREVVTVRSPKFDKKYTEDTFEDETCKKKKKRKRSDSDDLLLRAICPSKKAIKKLKAAKLDKRMIESCRCDDGKELTVVIKGVCLCDKAGLNKFKLDKICNEYTKLENKNTESVKSLLPHVADSLEVLKKRMSRSIEPVEKDRKENTMDPLESEKRKIKFNDNNETTEESKVKINNVKKTQQELGSTSTKLEKTLSVNSIKTEDKGKKINKKKLDVKNGKDKKTNLLESSSKKNVKLEEDKGATDSEERTKTTHSNESTRTLFQNKPQDPSNMGLTPEQSDKMKRS